MSRQTFKLGIIISAHINLDIDQLIVCYILEGKGNFVAFIVFFELELSLSDLGENIVEGTILHEIMHLIFSRVVAENIEKFDDSDFVCGLRLEVLIITCFCWICVRNSLIEALVPCTTVAQARSIFLRAHAGSTEHRVAFFVITLENLVVEVRLGIFITYLASLLAKFLIAHNFFK